MFTALYNFNLSQISLLFLAGIFFLGSLYSIIHKKNTLTLILLGCTAFCIFSFSAILDNFLNVWDERFHALVAKNMLINPFKPTLYNNPVVIAEYNTWDKMHIWLHKQPLFLWQIALSFKIFGVSEFSLRFPNIILGTILVIITYKTGKLIINEQVGYISAILAITSVYILELAAGSKELDHNDFSFMVYVSLSIWSFTEYYYSGNKKWIWAIGIFSGMAILCKWLVGLLIYFGWVILRIQQRKTSLSHNKDLFKALLITTLIALPWQVYTFIMFPQEASYALKYNILHFTTYLEGHRETFWYHFKNIDILYGPATTFLIIPAFYILYKLSDKKLIISLLSMVMIVYLFFTFALTKMPSFPIIVILIIWISLAAILVKIVSLLTQILKIRFIKTAIWVLAIIAITILRFDIKFFAQKHILHEYNFYAHEQTRYKKIFKTLVLPNNTVIFNIKDHHYIEAMFYTGLPAYHFIPSYVQYNDLKLKNNRIAIFKYNANEIPDFLNNDPDIIFINYELKN